MASVVKFTAGAVYNQLRHNLRQIAYSGNPDIDPARLRQDYVLSPDRGMSDYDYFQERLANCTSMAGTTLRSWRDGL